MGKGKGIPKDSWRPLLPDVFLLRGGRRPEIAQEALRLGAQKLPITTKFIVICVTTSKPQSNETTR